MKRSAQAPYGPGRSTFAFLCRMVGLHTHALAIVEDSDEDFFMFSRAFGGEADPIARWADAESALQAFRSGATNLSELQLLVVDIKLPGMDGLQLIEEARALPGGDKPAVCVLSSSSRDADRQRAARAGADGYLVKPANLAGLRALPSQLAEIAAAR